MLTEAIVETLNELMDAVKTHDIEIIFVWWESKVLSKSFKHAPYFGLDS
jgi:hypothetical protein